ncbi:MAG: hypothetical protein ACHQ7M_16780 [Chloroflexota bacterium]
MIEAIPARAAVNVGLVLPLVCGVKPGALQNMNILLSVPAVNVQLTVSLTLSVPLAGLHEAVLGVAAIATDPAPKPIEARPSPNARPITYSFFLIADTDLSCCVNGSGTVPL